MSKLGAFPSRSGLGQFVRSPLGARGKELVASLPPIYILFKRGITPTIKKISGTDGTELWSITLSGSMQHKLSVNSNAVFYGGSGGSSKIHRIDPANGAVTHTVSADRGLCVDDTYAYIASNFDRFAQYKASDLSFVREGPSPRPLFLGRTELVGPNGKPYIVSKNASTSTFRFVEFEPSTMAFSNIINIPSFIDERCLVRPRGDAGSSGIPHPASSNGSDINQILWGASSNLILDFRSVGCVSDSNGTYIGAVYDASGVANIKEISLPTGSTTWSFDPASKFSNFESDSSVTLFDGTRAVTGGVFATRSIDPFTLAILGPSTDDTSLIVAFDRSTQTELWRWEDTDLALCNYAQSLNNGARFNGMSVGRAGEGYSLLA